MRTLLKGQENEKLDNFSGSSVFGVRLGPSSRGRADGHGVHVSGSADRRE